MRFLVTALCWLIATAGLAVAVPAAWTQATIVDEDGYAVLAEQAARDPALQSAMASELTTRAMTLINERGGRPVDGATVHDVAAAFTAGSSFPPLFAQVNRAAHGWLFSAPQPGGNEQWVVDVAPMLKDTAIQQQLATYNVQVPATLKVPLTVPVGQPLRQGQFHRAEVWGPWVSIGVAALTALFAFLTVVAARSRGRGLTALGISALLVGAAGWAGIDIGKRSLNEALNRTTGDIRRMADVMVGHAESSMHLWLNITLLTGVGLVALGVITAMLGGLFSRKSQRSGS
ncbi:MULTISPECIES: hypothetical protein [unclassified Mycobacterium]|uniref:hypothetical protein n=1 Tax=unclassified Mycobacterium TaxID=2642494 RepID=UPI002740D522|nr:MULTISPECIES: hypothetical protein [unclassified Mycobacterium]MDP7704130.1 hypothetical protein [Mycobacterium sp. TY815]MDP7722613.1 hypothetical protein [Mycobacterium sp. TY814]